MIFEDNQNKTFEDRESPLGGLSIFKILTFLEANEHFCRMKGATIIKPIELDDGTIQIVFRGMNKLGEVGAKQILISKDDMKVVSEHEFVCMMSSALEAIVAFKEASEKLLVSGSGELIK